MDSRDLRIRVILSKIGDLVGPLRAIGNQAKSTNRALMETRTEVKALKAAEADVSAFRAQKAQLQATSAEYKKAQDRVAALAKAIEATSAPTKKLIADFVNSKKYAGVLKADLDRQGESLQQLRGRLRDVGISTRNLASDERLLRERTTEATERLKAQQAQLAELGKKERQLNAARSQLGRSQALGSNMAVSGYAAVRTGEAVLGPIAASVKAAGEFEQILTSARINMGATRDQAAGMARQIMKIAEATNQLPMAVAQGTNILTNMGLALPDALKMMAPIGRAATTYKAEVEDMGRLSFANFQNLKVPIDQTGKAIDIMASAAKSGKIEFKDMAGYFPTLTAAAAAFGQKGPAAVADLAAAFEVASIGAKSPEEAADNIKNLMVVMNEPRAINAFKKHFGVDLPAALKKLYAEGKTPLEAISMLVNKVSGGDLSKIGFMFENQQAQQALRPLIQNMDLYRKWRADALAANGVTEHDFADRMQDAEEQTKRASLATQELAINVGTLLVPTINAVVLRVGHLIAGIAAWTSRHPMLTKALVIIAAVLAVIITVLGGLAVAIGGILGPLALLEFAITVLEVELLPIIAVVAAVIAAFAAVVLVIVYWKEIGAFFGRLWDQIVAFFHSGIGNIMAMMVKWSPLGMVIQTFEAAWPTLKSWASQFFSWGGSLIDGIIDGIGSRLSALKSAIVDAASAASQWFKDKLGIHSPSRVFASHGLNLMQGLAGGIDDGRFGPLRGIERLSRDLTAALALGAAVASPVAAAGAGARGGGAAAAGAARAPAGHVIHIHAAPGQSAQDIAREVGRELDRRERLAASARHSTLSDYGD